jgi:hypothetical protein
VTAGRLAEARECYAWGGGVLFVLALVTEAIVSVGIKANQNDSAEEIARELQIHPPGLASLVLIGGVLFVALHAVSDIGITVMLGAKVAAYSAQHDPGLSYTLYLLTFALDSVGDVFGSLFFIAAGVLLLGGRELSRWLAWQQLPPASCSSFRGSAWAAPAPTSVSSSTWQRHPALPRPGRRGRVTPVQ